MLFLILALATFVALVQGQAAAGGGGAGTPIIVVKPKPGETIVPVNLSTSSAYVYWGGDWTPATSACSQDAMNLSSDGNGTVSFGDGIAGYTMSITLDAGGSVIIYNGNEAATYKHDDLVSLGTYNGCNVTGGSGQLQINQITGYNSSADMQSFISAATSTVTSEPLAQATMNANTSAGSGNGSTASATGSGSSATGSKAATSTASSTSTGSKAGDAVARAGISDAALVSCAVVLLLSILSF
ncbi:uncharacterized protein EHS24_005400 [Apiotrichum porosum]|uniref:Uncharacterized protein n=1 Tax=Apiotrichum porosum TaxID=105984 RepID=A0A427XD18_9TREE|nr:uncharacterized protein EHS24_005400 [Apiotrichum porosum]RSH76653.1 hypothetical protein EHS24_005400 [Apiotrichum porosum]